MKKLLSEVKGNYDKDSLIIAMLDYVDQHGQFPSIREWNRDKNTPSSMPYRKHFTSWSNAIKTITEIRGTNELRNSIKQFREDLKISRGKPDYLIMTYETAKALNIPDDKIHNFHDNSCVVLVIIQKHHTE